MLFGACIIAAMLSTGEAANQISPPVEDGALEATRPVLDPSQRTARTDWPGWPDAAAVTTVVYDVKRGGKPANCRIVGSSGSRRYDRMACDIVSHRDRYTPGFAGYGPEPRTGVQQTFRWAPLDDYAGASDAAVDDDF